MSRKLIFHDICAVDFHFFYTEKDIEDSIKIDPEPFYVNDDPREFAVKFNIRIDMSKSQSILEAVIFAKFSTDKDIDEEFKKSPFPVLNAPAIAYPFIRSFIHNFLLNSGNPVILLPSINFSQRYKEQMKTEDQSEKSDQC